MEQRPGRHVLHLIRKEGEGMFLVRMKPSVPKKWLLGLAGSTWSVVGALLCRLAYDWLQGCHWTVALAMGVSGLVLAAAGYRFGFSRIAMRNIERIRSGPESPCLFSFQAWRGYLAVGLMVTIGAVLRRSPFPESYLVVPYTAMGGALLLASLLYYRSLWRNDVVKNQSHDAATRDFPPSL